jgi:hypothetical protein
MTPQALAAFATLVSFAVHGNRVELKLDRGSAELVWTSAGAFHFRRTLDGALTPAATERATDPVDFKVDDTPTALHLRSKLLDVAIEKHGVLVKVSGPDGAVLMTDLTEPRPGGGGLAWARAAPPGVRFYGLGRIDDPEMDLRGKVVDSVEDLLISTAGYAEQEAFANFDFTVPGQYRVEAPQVNYGFFYGPKPKEIFERLIPSTFAKWQQGQRFPQQPTWGALRSHLFQTVHQAMSSPNLLPFDLGGSDKATTELNDRIRQVASLTPQLPRTFAPSAFRQQLASFFDIYEIETRDRGFPLWHPLPFQFPTDPECAHHADEFMLGDEMLVAPIYEPGNKRQVYFPPGSWTSLETNREYPGRTTATIETPALPVFAHKGAIVPLDSEGGIALHYFPDLGGEFFLLEKDLGAYTQVHAAPAADIMRLEIDAKKARDYEWVVHHVERPTAVAFEDRQYTWTYDAALKNLLIRVSVKEGEDNVIHISW